MMETGKLMFAPGTVCVSVSCPALSVLSIIRDNFLYIIITNIINQQSNTKNADNSPHFMTFGIGSDFLLLTVQQIIPSFNV